MKIEIHLPIKCETVKSNFTHCHVEGLLAVFGTKGVHSYSCTIMYVSHA